MIALAVFDLAQAIVDHLQPITDMVEGGSREQGDLLVLARDIFRLSNCLESLDGLSRFFTGSRFSCCSDDIGVSPVSVRRTYARARRCQSRATKIVRETQLTKT